MSDCVSFPQVWFDAAVASGDMTGSVTISLDNIYSLKHMVNASVKDYEALLTFNFSLEEVGHVT